MDTRSGTTGAPTSSKQLGAYNDAHASLRPIAALPLGGLLGANASRVFLGWNLRLQIGNRCDFAQTAGDAAHEEWRAFSWRGSYREDSMSERIGMSGEHMVLCNNGAEG